MGSKLGKVVFERRTKYRFKSRKRSKAFFGGDIQGKKRGAQQKVQSDAPPRGVCAYGFKGFQG